MSGDAAKEIWDLLDTNITEVDILKTIITPRIIPVIPFILLSTQLTEISFKKICPIYIQIYTRIWLQKAGEQEKSVHELSLALIPTHFIP